MLPWPQFARAPQVDHRGFRQLKIRKRATQQMVRLEPVGPGGQRAFRLLTGRFGITGLETAFGKQQVELRRIGVRRIGVGETREPGARADRIATAKQRIGGDQRVTKHPRHRESAAIEKAATIRS